MMFRAHPIVTTVGIVYFGVLCFVTMGPRADNGSSFGGTLVLFVPAGLLLVLLLGRHHWFAALLVGVVGVVWLELACIVWRPDAPAVPTDVLSSSIGVSVGILLGLAVSRLRSRPHTQRVHSFTRLSQTGSSRLSSESPRD
jgi:dolichol kinase